MRATHLIWDHRQSDSQPLNDCQICCKVTPGWSRLPRGEKSLTDLMSHFCCHRHSQFWVNFPPILSFIPRNNGESDYVLPCSFSSIISPSAVIKSPAELATRNESVTSHGTISPSIFLRRG